MPIRHDVGFDRARDAVDFTGSLDFFVAEVRLAAAAARGAGAFAGALAGEAAAVLDVRADGDLVAVPTAPPTSVLPFPAGARRAGGSTALGLAADFALAEVAFAGGAEALRAEAFPMAAFATAAFGVLAAAGFADLAALAGVPAALPAEALAARVAPAPDAVFVPAVDGAVAFDAERPTERAFVSAPFGIAVLPVAAGFAGAWPTFFAAVRPAFGGDAALVAPFAFAVVRAVAGFVVADVAGISVLASLLATLVPFGMITSSRGCHERVHARARRGPRIGPSRHA